MHKCNIPNSGGLDKVITDGSSWDGLTLRDTIFAMDTFDGATGIIKIFEGMYSILNFSKEEYISQGS